MTDLPAVMSAFRAATQCEATVWTQATPDGRIAVEASTMPDAALDDFPQLAEGIRPIDTPAGRMLVSAVPGPRRAWLALGPCAHSQTDLESYMRFMLPVVSQYLQ